MRHTGAVCMHEAWAAGAPVLSGMCLPRWPTGRSWAAGAGLSAFSGGEEGCLSTSCGQGRRRHCSNAPQAAWTGRPGSRCCPRQRCRAGRCARRSRDAPSSGAFPAAGGWASRSGARGRHPHGPPGRRHRRRMRGRRFPMWPGPDGHSRQQGPRQGVFP